MVLNCVANGCTNLHDARNPTPFHTFPFKRPEVLKHWISAINRENWYPSKTSRLCGKHFVANDYQNKPGYTRKLLKPDAVPSIFSVPKHSEATLPQKILVNNVSLIKNGTDEVEHDKCSQLNLPSNLTTPAKIFVDRNIQTTGLMDTEETVHQLRREIEILKEKIHTKDIEITSLREIMKEISKSDHRNTHLDTVLIII